MDPVVQFSSPREPLGGRITEPTLDLFLRCKMSSIHEIDDGQIRQMQLSLYDRVSAVLWSLTMIFGVLALFSVIMWLQLARHQAEVIAGAATYVPIPLGMGEPGDPRPLGVGDDAEDPGIEEFYEVDMPQLADAVEAVTDAPSRFRGMLGEFDGDAEFMGKGRGLGSKTGGGGGGGGSADRWSIEYESENLGKYVEQLGAFGVEIGFVSKVIDRVEVLIDLQTAPQIRAATKADERRIYFIHSNSKLRSWDLRLAQNAGVKPDGKIMVQFYPEATKQRLLQLEAAEAVARNIDPQKIQRTTFRVRPAGNGYEYFVADMVSK